MEPGSFEVIPTLYLQRRKLVTHAGEPLAEPAVPKIRELASKGFVCVVDLQGLGRNKADLDTLRQAADKGNVWADAASRFATDAMDLLVAGASRVTLRWSALADETELREACEFAEEDAIVLGLEYEGPSVARRMLPNRQLGGEDRALALARELGLGIAVLDLERAGSLHGVDRGLASRHTASGLARWYGGGLRDMEDSRALEAMGYRGCFVGSAMLRGAWK